MAKLIDIAEIAEGMYYQDYAERNAFFDKRDFRDQLAMYYSTALNELFKIQRKESKQETGFNNVEIPPAWLIHETAKMTCESGGCVVETKHPIYSFDFDNFVYALDSVTAPDVQLRKISRTEANFLHLQPNINRTLFWVQEKNKIKFTKDIKTELSLAYIPAVVGSDDNCVLSDNIVSGVIKAVLQIMFGAKTGNVVDETNDGNKNNVVAQQVNPGIKPVS